MLETDLDRLQCQAFVLDILMPSVLRILTKRVHFLNVYAEVFTTVFLIELCIT